MTTVRWQSVVDFLVLALGLYLLLRWSRAARALRLALSIVGLRVAALVARQLNLVITGWVLDAATIVVVLALVVIFQPELRRALMRLDLRGRAARNRGVSIASAVSVATAALARRGCGALIVIRGRDSIDEIVTEGVRLDGRVSPEILEAIFNKDSAVHDGAAIIDGDVITSVGTVLPLTNRARVPAGYGTRHRAGMGLAERADAIVVVVSEERGEITLMHGSTIQLVSDANELVAALDALTAAGGAPRRSFDVGGPRDLIIPLTALALSAMVWGLTFLLPGSAVRVQSAPLEFTSVPRGLTITSQSTDTVALWVRGSDFILDSVNLELLVARCDLSSAHEGINTIDVPTDFDLPLGLRVDRISPRQVTVHLAKISQPVAARGGQREGSVFPEFGEDLEAGGHPALIAPRGTVRPERDRAAGGRDELRWQVERTEVGDRDEAVFLHAAGDGDRDLFHVAAGGKNRLDALQQ